MAFLTFCPNKKCGKEMTPLIDKETNSVHCSECDAEILNIDPFMKRQMVFSGHVKKTVKRKASFAVKCKYCNEEDRPVMKGNNAFCKHCNRDITATLSIPFIQMLKTI